MRVFVVKISVLRSFSAKGRVGWSTLAEVWWTYALRPNPVSSSSWHPIIGRISSNTASRSTTKRKSSTLRRDRWLFVCTLAMDGTCLWPTDSCVDFRRFYIPYGVPREHGCPICNGVSLRLDEWAQLLELVSTICECNPELVDVQPQIRSI